MPSIQETERLRLREVTPDDAGFICELMNEPAYLENIGDRGVRDVADAARYIAEKFQGSYERQGFGLYQVETLAGVPVGISGLVKREVLPHPDIGFAFLRRYWGHGYAHEAGAIVMELARTRFALTEVYGVVLPSNVRSIRLLEKLGLTPVGSVQMPNQPLASLLYRRHFARVDRG